VTKPDGAIDYFVAIFEDTTARHEAGGGAARTSTCSNVSPAQTEFLTMVSHEIRTPWSGSRGSAS